MPNRKRTSLRKAALALEMSENEGRSERDIAKALELPPSTVHTIVSGAHGWGQIADSSVVKRYRAEQNAALEQVNRTMAAEALKKAWGKMDHASYYQLVISASIMTDKARLLAGESTQNVEIHTKAELQNLENFCELLRQSLIQPEKSAIDVTQGKQSPER